MAFARSYGNQCFLGSGAMNADCILIAIGMFSFVVPDALRNMRNSGFIPASLKIITDKWKRDASKY